ncbi:hypothetical protein [Mycoplasmoides pirum]|uniref:hypothetical protein n=1 Tax=Mycoplasmoides pirum TaxID=2122 RepID=UPI00048817E8|nr:hypothetical protein [Mycoplasmoides pirum]
MKKWEKTKSLYIYIYSLVILLVVSVSSLFIFDLSNTVLYSPINTSNSTKVNEDLNYYKYAKVDSMYPVKILRKTGDDRRKINFLFLGDNYAENADPNVFSNLMYSNIVLPWLSSPTWGNNTDGYYKSYTQRTRIPYQTFLNDKFNIYSIQPNYKTESSSSIPNSFFGMTTSNFTSVANFGVTKFRVLSYDLSKNFLEDGGLIKPDWIAMVRNGGDGRANTNPFGKQYNTTTKDSTWTHIHEQGHSIYGLEDEYEESKPDGAANSVHIVGINDDLSNAENFLSSIRWREFLGFRGISLVENSKFPNYYIPSYDCLMSNGKNYIDFCEVCTHQMIKRATQITQQELFYIADPQLTLKENRPVWNKKFSADNIYSRITLEEMELYDYNIENASSKHLDFRTVIDNLTSKARRIKAKISITNSSKKSKFSEESEIYTIQPQELKGITFQTKTSAPSGLINNQDEIIGEIVDADTNEVLATSLDRINENNQKKVNNSKENENNNIEKNVGKELHKVSINFIDKSTSKPLPDIKPTILIKRDKTKFKLEKILFNGYKLDANQSKIDNQELMINGQDQEFNYYYEKLPSKKLKLKLIDPSKNNETIQQKEVTVYEGQTFVPSDSDFFLYDLENFNNDNSNYNNEWKQSVVYPKINYDYNNINNDSELIYSISDKIPYHTLGNDIEINQGDNIASIKDDYDHFVEYDHTFSQKINNKNIIWNEVDTSTPGYYKLYFFHDYSEINRKNKLSDPFAFQMVNVKVKKIDGYTPDPLEVEINRINSLMLWMKNFEQDRGTLNIFESLNKDNLLDNLPNFNFNKTKFNYEVIDLQKDSWGSTGYSKEIKFKIRITEKISKNFKESKLFEKYIYLNENPSTPTKDLISVDNEIIRINSIKFKLKKDKFTQNEINLINENNFASQINWNDVTNNSLLTNNYSIVNFKKGNNIFTFQIQVTSKQNLISQDSYSFILPYTIDNNIQEDELVNEKLRIDSLNLSLKKNSFSSLEINNLINNPDSLKNNLNNWEPKEGFTYKFVLETKQNENQLSLVININKNNEVDRVYSSKEFLFEYQLNDPIPEKNDLQIEKERIDNLSLSLNKTSFTNDELNNLIKNPNSLLNYLNNWSTTTGFLYEFEITNNLQNKQLNLIIKISKINDSNNKITSKTFVFNYLLQNDESKPDQPSIPENPDVKPEDKPTINPENPITKEDNSNNTLLISLSVSIPLVVIVASIISYFVFKKIKK